MKICYRFKTHFRDGLGILIYDNLMGLLYNIISVRETVNYLNTAMNVRPYRQTDELKS